MSQNTNAPTGEVGAVSEATNQSMTPFLNYAEKFASRGWHIHPLKPMGKEPIIKAWQLNASREPVQISKWMAQYPNANIGIATEVSGLLVIDCDYPKEKKSVPPEWALDGVTDGTDVLSVVAERYGATFPTNTLTVKTPNKGWHLYFNDCSKPVKSSAGVNGMWLVDTRSSGGYIVAPGSVLATGVYEQGIIDEVADCPGWIRDAITPRPLRPTIAHPISNFSPPGSKSTKYFQIAIENIIRELLNSQQGTRNVSLNRAAFSVGRLIRQRPEIYEMALGALCSSASIIGLEDYESKRTIQGGIKAGLVGGHNAS